MSKPSILAVLALSFVTLAGTAWAQPEPSAREREYGAALARSLGRTNPRVTQLRRSDIVSDEFNDVGPHGHLSAWALQELESLRGRSEGSLSAEEVTRLAELLALELESLRGRSEGSLSAEEVARLTELQTRLVELPPRDPSSQPRREPEVTGVRVALDGLEVERLKFETPELAQRHVRDAMNLRTAPDDLRPLSGELRGNQVVLVRGEGVRDAAFARRAAEAAWKGLPAPKESRQASFANFGERELVLTTTLAAGPLREGVDNLLGAVRDAVARRSEQARLTGPDSARFENVGGLTGELRADADGASFWSSPESAGEASTKRYFDVLGGHPTPPAAPSGTARATEGAAKRIEGLFGR